MPRAAPSNAHKEIPTKFGRAVQIRAGSTFFMVTATKFNGNLRTTGSGEDVQVEVTFSNIGSDAWSGDVTRSAQLLAELSNGNKKRDVLLAPSRFCGAESTSGLRLSVAPKTTKYSCLQFKLPADASLELFKFSFDPKNFARVNPKPGNGYGVWALPGTLTEACRFAPSTVKGKCRGLEVGEKK